MLRQNLYLSDLSDEKVTSDEEASSHAGRRRFIILLIASLGDQYATEPDNKKICSIRIILTNTPIFLNIYQILVMGYELLINIYTNSSFGSLTT